MAMDVVFSEANEKTPIEAVPLSHLSIEVGHLFQEDLEDSDDRLREQFERNASWITMATLAVKAKYGTKARVSTCFLLDDYVLPRSGLKPVGPPAEVLARLTEQAHAHGFTIDYIVREAGCAVSCEQPRARESDRVALAEIVAGLVVPEPAEGANGARLPTGDSGWLCNGIRSPKVDQSPAMSPVQWEPPEEYGKYKHSIFLDAQLWSSAPEWATGERVDQLSWSCAFLAAVWQLLRLGLLRDGGRAVARPYLWTGQEEWPEEWSDLPTVLQMDPDAAPFAAYQALSVLPQRYLPVEHAVRVVLEHLSYDAAVLDQIAARAAAEGIVLPGHATERLSYGFATGF
jgi:hypothetical protein